MKNYYSLSVSRTVSQLIMRVHKPKVEYKLALQEKPQGSILTYYYKTNNLTRINWLNTRLIIASNKIRHEIPFKTKRVKYTAIWKKSIKIVKESKVYFFYHVSLLNFFHSLHHGFNIFPQFYYFPSSTILLTAAVFARFKTIFHIKGGGGGGEVSPRKSDFLDFLSYKRRLKYFFGMKCPVE